MQALHRGDPGQVGDDARQHNKCGKSQAFGLGHARRLGENIPTAEKFATIAQIVADQETVIIGALTLIILFGAFDNIVSKRRR